MEVLAEANLRRFVVINISHFREIAPAQMKSLKDEELVDLLMEMAHEASGFGIELAGHLRRYLEAALLLGHSYTSNPKHGTLVEILRDPGVGPDTKLDQLDDYLVFRS